MKTTIKLFNQKVQERKQLLRRYYEINDKVSSGIDLRENTPIWSDLKKQIKTLDNEYFNKLNKVYISFSAGQKSFYREAIKIRNTYFVDYEKATQKNGYSYVNEIPEITQEMIDEMTEDAYYF